MKAWVLHNTRDLTKDTEPLKLSEEPTPSPKDNEVLLRVECCGICHTELDEIEGRTPPPKYPVIPGHQVVGVVLEKGKDREEISVGDRVGVAWIAGACGKCEFCEAGYENLCKDFVATGRDINGGYAQFMVVDEQFVYSIPDAFKNEEAAPLLCAGAIGYRSLRLADLKDGGVLGLSGFGASGHLVLKTAKYLYPQSPIFVFARSKEEQDFARSLGCDWAGDFSSTPPSLVNAIIDTTPAWTPVISSLEFLKPGGRLVINAIRKESQDQHILSSLDYHRHLWMEKEIKSVANITRRDVEDFLKIASKMSIKPQVETYPFERANEALIDLRNKHVRGAKVLLVQQDH
jgi:propanol-preferring alcohol dehydrogenase